MQDKTVNISYQRATVSTVTAAITRQTGIVFSYESSLASFPMKDVKVKGDLPVDEILAKVFAGSGISYSVVGKAVVLTADVSSSQKSSHITVSGTVKDDKGNPLPGVGVLENGNLRNGVITNVLGQYSIRVKGNAVLEFSSIGFEKNEIPVNGRASIDVVMKESNTLLDEVVVIGYGSQSRRTLTSAVSRVSGESIEGTSATSVGDALKGKISGVRISSSNNSPGEAPVFLVRGGSSINQSNAPIVLVDGVQRAMDNLNPNDIESIEVLKDAASAGIYGANASNGVILITTKKGSRSKGPQISFNLQGGWESPATRYDLMNGGDYLTFMRTALNECPGYAYGQSVLWGANSAGVGNSDNSIWTPRYLKDGESVPSGWKSIVDPVDESKTIIYQDNDQQSSWFRDSYYENYYVGVNGGNDKVTYAASTGYTKDGGIGINTDYSHITFHGNTTFKVTKNITAGTSFDYSQQSGNTIPSGGIGNYWTVLGRGMFMPNTHRDYLSDGTPAQGTNKTVMSSEWFKTYYTSNYMTKVSTANFNLNWKITPDLIWYSQVAFYDNCRRGNQYLAGNAISTLRKNTEKWTDNASQNFQTYLKYNKDFLGQNHFDAMAGYEYRYHSKNVIKLTTEGAVSDKVPTTSAGTTVTSYGDTQTPLCQISYFGRLNYDYAKKYLLTFTMRADASSLFAAGHRWGFFPAASAG
jgi:TonB-linked SusC/RagA family outer membrane protein